MKELIMTSKNERFLTVYKKTTFGTETRVLVDRETGINYLYYGMQSAGGGLTPLLDREGRPIVTSVYDTTE